ncbi:transposase IS4 family protein [Pseudomonas antarctica]|uniref:Transposase IS4 family protein n=2 Tax=Pseudomonas antarctica TaxID=219572 RepID=A0A172Z178_9PSED|nr:transposase IS4 family protein [Pseudomonas antarctica]
MLCDANGVPLRFLLSGGQASDIAYAQPLLDEAYIPSLSGRPRKRCRWLLADKGYDAEALRRYCDRYRMQPAIPLRDMKRKPRPGLPRLFDRPKYRQRNIIERMFGWLKENRRIVPRFDKLATSFAAMVSLACAMRCLRQYFSYRT